LSSESLSKIERQRQLARYLERDPFLTDVDLSKILRVSIQTIRLDRLDLKIPELRERLKNVARGMEAVEVLP
jgi:DeoR/GlpR family transcriptional regulator of sugar metabolism